MNVLKKDRSPTASAVPRAKAAIIVAATAAVAFMVSFATGDGGQLTPGGLSRVAHGSAFTGSGTSGNPLNLTGVNCSGSAVSAIDASGSATCISAGGGGSTAVFADSPLAGSGSSGSHLTWTPTLDSSIAGTGSAGNSLKVNLSTTAELTGTGSAGSPLTTVHNGTVTSVTCGTGLSGGAITGSGTCSTNLTGGACSVGQVVTNISATGATTCGVVDQNDYGGTVTDWADEFFLNSALNTGMWAASTNGTAAIANTIDPGGVRVGIQSPSATTSTSRYAMIQNGDQILLGHGTWVLDWVIGVPNLSTSGEEFELIFGFADTTNSVNQVDGCYFAYDRGNVMAAPTTGAGNTTNESDLMCWCSSNSTRTGYVMDGSIVSDGSFTTVAAPVAAVTWPSTNVLDTEIQINAAATEADFFVNGTKSCVITTHIPTAASRQTSIMFALIRSAGAGATARTTDIDRFHARFTRASARTP